MRATYSRPIQLVLIILLLAVTTACDNSSSQQEIDRQAVMEEMEQREVRRILPADLVEAAYLKGREISSKADAVVWDNYSLADDTLFDASQAIKIQAYQTIDSLEEANEVEVNYVNLRTDTSTLVSKELQLWEAYLYNVENDLPLNDNVQRLGDDRYLYTKPIFLEEKVNHTTSDNSKFFAGMWSIVISKKTLIQSM